MKTTVRLDAYRKSNGKKGAYIYQLNIHYKDGKILTQSFADRERAMFNLKLMVDEYDTVIKELENSEESYYIFCTVLNSDRYHYCTINEEILYL